MVGVQTEAIKQWVSPDGVTINYGLSEQRGARLVVLVHGLASNMTRWTEFLCQTTLREDFALLRVDLRGHGQSRYRGKLSHEQWVRDLNGLIRSEGYKEVVVIGHSLGAQVAIMFARYYPEMAKGCVLIDPIFSETLRGRRKWLSRFRWIFRWLASLSLLANRAGLYRREVPVRDLFELDRHTRKFLQDNSGSNIAELYLNPTDDLKYLPAVIYFQDVHEVLRPIRGLQGIACPCLLMLSGGTDISDTKLGIDVCERARDCEYKVFNVDHWLLTEQPQEARETIDGWCLEYMRKGAPRRRRELED